MEMPDLIFWDRESPHGIGRAVARGISAILQRDMELHENPVIITGFIGRESLYDAHGILNSLEIYRWRKEIIENILLIIPYDIRQGINSPVYGLARPESKVAVVSTERLKNEHYGHPPSDIDLIERLSKEGTHELGHLLGLKHCEDTECIMYSPRSLDDLERKKKHFCKICNALLINPTD